MQTSSNKILCLCLSSILCVTSYAQRGKPVIGISLDRHASPVRAYSADSTRHRMATLAQDRTLRIWDYPSMDPLDMVPLPEDPESDGVYSFVVFHPLQENLALVTEETSGQSRILVVDLDTHRLLQTVPFRGENVRDIQFMEGGSKMLISSSGEYAAIYDSVRMNLLWDVSLLDERICGVEFLDSDRFLLVTDMFIRSYQMTLLAGGDVVRVQELKRTRLPYVRNDVFYMSSVTVDPSAGVAYVGQTTEWKSFLMHFDVSTLRLLDKKSARNVTFGEFVFQDEMKGRTAGVTPLLKSPLKVSGLSYRSVPAPMIDRVKDTLYIRYAGEPLWALTPTGLVRLGNEARMPSEKNEKRPDIFAGELLDLYVEMGDGVRVDSPYKVIYYYGRRVNKEDSGTIYFKRTFPVNVAGIENWFTEDCFVLSLEDGTVRVVDSHTGKEVMALFIGKEGEWIMWRPDGVFTSSSMDSFNLIEWRYQWFGQVEVRKPYQERAKYFKPGMFSRFLRELSAGVSTSTVGGLDEEVVFQITEAERRENHFRLRYVLEGYDPLENGPYHIDLEVNETPFSDFTLIPVRNGGILEVDVNPENEVSRLDISLMTENRRALAFDAYIPEIIPEISRIRYLLAGVSEYQGSGMPSLVSAASDAEDFADVLRGSKSPVDGKSVVLTNGMASSERITESFEAMLGQGGSDVLTILYLSGHGVRSLDDRFLFVTGAGRKEERNLDVAALLARWPREAGPLLVIVDACNSGLLAQAVAGNVGILASSEWNQQSRDGNVLDNSLFTRSLMERLSMDRSDRKSCTLEQLFLETREDVVRGSEGLQCPVSCLGDFFTDFNLMEVL